MMGQPGGMMDMMGGWMTGATLYGTLAGGLVVVVLALLAVWLVQQIRRGAGAKP